MKPPRPPQRPTPMWPTYLARVAALVAFLAAPFVFRRYGFPVETGEQWFIALLVSGVLSLVVGNVVMAFFEWLVDAHRDSVETKARFNFGIMMLTAGILALGVATFVIQWHKA